MVSLEPAQQKKTPAFRVQNKNRSRRRVLEERDKLIIRQEVHTRRPSDEGETLIGAQKKQKRRTQIAKREVNKPVNNVGRMV